MASDPPIVDETSWPKPMGEPATPPAEMTAEDELKVWREWFATSTGGAWEDVDDIEAELGRRSLSVPATPEPIRGGEFLSAIAAQGMQELADDDDSDPPEDRGDPEGFEEWYAENADDHYEQAARDAALMVWRAVLASAPKGVEPEPSDGVRWRHLLELLARQDRHPNGAEDVAGCIRQLSRTVAVLTSKGEPEPTPLPEPQTDAELRGRLEKAAKRHAEAVAGSYEADDSWNELESAALAMGAREPQGLLEHVDVLHDAASFRKASDALDKRLGHHRGSVVQACEDYVMCEDLLDDSFDSEEYSLPWAVGLLMEAKAERDALIDAKVEPTPLPEDPTGYDAMLEAGDLTYEQAYKLLSRTEGR